MELLTCCCLAGVCSMDLAQEGMEKTAETPCCLAGGCSMDLAQEGMEKTAETPCCLAGGCSMYLAQEGMEKTAETPCCLAGGCSMDLAQEGMEKTAETPSPGIGTVGTVDPSDLPESVNLSHEMNPADPLNAAESDGSMDLIDGGMDGAMAESRLRSMAIKRNLLYLVTGTKADKERIALECVSKSLIPCVLAESPILMKNILLTIIDKVNIDRSGTAFDNFMEILHNDTTTEELVDIVKESLQELRHNPNTWSYEYNTTGEPNDQSESVGESRGDSAVQDSAKCPTPSISSSSSSSGRNLAAVEEETSQRSTHSGVDRSPHRGTKKQSITLSHGPPPFFQLQSNPSPSLSSRESFGSTENDENSSNSSEDRGMVEFGASRTELDPRNSSSHKIAGGSPSPVHERDYRSSKAVGTPSPVHHRDYRSSEVVSRDVMENHHSIPDESAIEEQHFPPAMSATHGRHEEQFGHNNNSFAS